MSLAYDRTGWTECNIAIPNMSEKMVNKALGFSTVPDMQLGVTHSVELTLYQAQKTTSQFLFLAYWTHFNSNHLIFVQDLPSLVSLLRELVPIIDCALNTALLEDEKSTR